MAFKTLSFLINLYVAIASYAQNYDTCLNCSFNIIANNNIGDIHMQSCPITTSIHSTNQMSAVKCADTSQNGYYSINKCDIIAQLPSYTTTIDTSPYDLTIVRRRQLFSTQISNYLIKTCISYQIIGIIHDCMHIDSIFLPLCSNTNTSKLVASDITQLIQNETFANENNVKHAVGVNINGNLGISVELISINNFKICIGNIIINKHNLNVHDLDMHTIGTSDGSINIVANSDTNATVDCNADGLPCFDFFFKQECVPNITNDSDDQQDIGDLTENIDASYTVMIYFGSSTLQLESLWSIVLFIAGVIILNMILYYCFCSKSVSLTSSNSDEESKISDMETANINN